MLERMLTAGVPKVTFKWDDSEWKGPGKEPWWFRQCSPKMRQAYIDQLARQGKWRGKLKEAKGLHLEFTSSEEFGCKNLAHFAVALADLDCTLRITGPKSHVHIRDGKIRWPNAEGVYDYREAEPVPPGWTIKFDVSGPDAKKAVPVVRQTFRQGLKNHLAVIRQYDRLQKQRHGRVTSGGKVEAEVPW